MQRLTAANISRQGSSEGGRNIADMDDVTTIEPDHDERERVESWRLHILIEAGYPLPLAERVAGSEADLHEAVDLVTRRGCTPELAASILL